MDFIIDGYKTNIVPDTENPDKVGHILVEHNGKLTDEILENILIDIASRYAWLYEQSRTSTLKVRIKSITTLSRMHSIEEYDCKEFFVGNDRTDL